MHATALEADPALVESPLALEDVVCVLDGRRVLDGVTLPLARGRITVLVGPSGGGKTVCVRNLAGLLTPTRGRVLADGQDLRELSPADIAAVRRRMSVMMQGATLFGCALFGSLSVYDNIAYPLRRREHLSTDEIDDRVRPQLAALGLDAHADLLPGQLSAGTSRRVALARALISESEILILDDVDSGLDRAWLSGVRDLIRDAQRAAGTTVLLTTHDPAMAAELADVLAVLRAGRVVALGPPADILGDRAAFPSRFLDGDKESGLAMDDELEAALLQPLEPLPEPDDLEPLQQAAFAGTTAVATVLYAALVVVGLLAVAGLIYATVGLAGGLE